MYTSCGWFFNELSGIETVQVIQYAGRAIQLAEQLFGVAIEEEFLQKLELAKSNVTEFKNGRMIYEKFVRPAAMDLSKVAAHYAISSLFENGSVEDQSYCYTIDYEDYKTYEAGRARLVMGWVRVTSQITTESEKLVFAILHLGDHNINGGVGPFLNPEAYKTTVDGVLSAFKKGDFTETIHTMDRYFGSSTYSLKSLFKDEQRKILNSILEDTLSDSESMLRQVYENNAPLMRFLSDLMVPLPKALEAAAEFTLNMNLKRFLEADELDLDKIASLLMEARESRIQLDQPGLTYSLQKNLERMMEQLWADPEDLNLLAGLKNAVAFASEYSLKVNLWSVQNNYYEILQQIYPGMKQKADEGDEQAKSWMDTFFLLGENLTVRIF
jgi:hypothetical protein